MQRLCPPLAKPQGAHVCCAHVAPGQSREQSSQAFSYNVYSLVEAAVHGKSPCYLRNCWAGWHGGVLHCTCAQHVLANPPHRVAGDGGADCCWMIYNWRKCTIRTNEQNVNGPFYSKLDLLQCNSGFFSFPYNERNVLTYRLECSACVQRREEMVGGILPAPFPMP